MKFILALLMVPSIITLGVAGICAAFFFFFAASETAQAYSFGGHLLKGFVYLSVGLGLPCAIFSALAGGLLMVLSFIFKTWTKAFLCGGVVLGGAWIWYYLLNSVVP